MSTGPATEDILESLKKTSEPIVAKFAEAALDDLAHPTSQPATTEPSLSIAPTTALSAPAFNALPTTALTVNFGI